MPRNLGRNGGMAGPAALLCLMLAACNSGAPTPAGGVSEAEAEALAEAAEMLDAERTLPDEAVPEDAVPPTAPPSPEMTGDTPR